MKYLLTQVPRTAMCGMSAEVTMLQVKDRTKDYRGEPQSQQAQTEGKGDGSSRTKDVGTEASDW